MSLTVHSRRNRRGRTEVDIATKYYEEEKETTKKILAKKKKQKSSKISESTSSIKLPKTIQVEKKKKHLRPKKQTSDKKPSFRSRVKNKIKKPKRIIRKGREGKRQISKQKRAKYFDRYKI
jgi:hypothetical protein